MGIVHRGIPQQMALELARRYGIARFFETGTHVGKTAAWARQHFDVVITIEAHGEYFRQNLKRYPDSDILFLFGASQARMRELVPLMKEPHMFWLDAHWGADLPYSRPEVVCPVIEEIEIINQSLENHVILVDDARLFTGINGWPSLETVMRFLGERSRDVYVEDDVVIAVPSWKEFR